MLWAAPGASAQSKTAQLHVEVEGLMHERGQLGLLLYESAEGFPMDYAKAMRNILLPIEDGQVQYTFADLPYGRYAVAIMHDENGNEQLDTNLFGIPKEGNGVSNNAKGSFGPPSFEDAAIIVDQPKVTIRIAMNY